MAWVLRRISTGLLLRNFVVVYLANFVGSLGIAGLIYCSGHLDLNGGAVRETAVAIAAAKMKLPWMEAFCRGILCNILVCLAIWLAAAGRQVVNRVLAIVFPITAFVASGFEHSVANMYFFALGILCDPASVTWTGAAANLLPVTLGNLVGGAGMVGLVASVIYRRGGEP
jgi:formate/nitrite transporter